MGYGCISCDGAKAIRYISGAGRLARRALLVRQILSRRQTKAAVTAERTPVTSRQHRQHHGAKPPQAFFSAL